MSEEQSSLSPRKDATRNDFNTTYKGTYVELCKAAASEDPAASAHLWGALFPLAMAKVGRAFQQDTVVEELATEITDRYVLGWINGDKPRGTGKPGPVPAKITSCTVDYAYAAHWEKCLDNFIADVFLKRSDQDPVLANRVNYDYMRPEANPAMEGGDDDALDDVEGEAQYAADPRAENDPAYVIEKKEIFNQFRAKLDERQQLVLDYMLEGYTQAEIAGFTGMAIITIKRDYRAVKEALAQWMSTQK